MKYWCVVEMEKGKVVHISKNRDMAENNLRFCKKYFKGRFTLQQKEKSQIGDRNEAEHRP